MLIEYLQAAIRKAHYELMEDGTFYGSVPGFPGAWAVASTLEGCRDELAEVLDGWVVVTLRAGEDLPEVDGTVLAADRPS